MKNRIPGFLTRNNVTQAFYALLIFAVLSSIFVPRFLRSDNLYNLIRQGSLIFSFSIGMAVTMLLAGLDLSIGAVGALSTVFAAVFITQGNSPAGVILCLFIGVICGCLSGIAISKLLIPPFIMTFGMMKIANGIALNFTKGESIYGFSESFRFLGIGNIFGIPVPIIISLILLIVMHLFITNTVYGKSFYAIGANRQSAYLSGLQKDRIIIIGYGISGLLSAFAGLLYIARLGSAEGTMGGDWPLQAIAACVLGGVSFSGGEGSIAGLWLGAMSVAIIYNVLNLLGISPSWQQFVIGFIIIFIIALNNIRNRFVQKKQMMDNLKFIETK